MKIVLIFNVITTTDRFHSETQSIVVDQAIVQPIKLTIRRVYFWLCVCEPKKQKSNNLGYH